MDLGYIHGQKKKGSGGREYPPSRHSVPVGHGEKPLAETRANVPKTSDGETCRIEGGNMKLQIELKLDGLAFRRDDDLGEMYDPERVARELEGIAARIRAGQGGLGFLEIVDDKGRRVGTVKIG